MAELLEAGRCFQEREDPAYFSDELLLQVVRMCVPRFYRMLAFGVASRFMRTKAHGYIHSCFTKAGVQVYGTRVEAREICINFLSNEFMEYNQVQVSKYDAKQRRLA